MPIGNVLVGDSRCDVEHDDTALAVDVVTISETTELLLSCGIPDIELDPSVVLEYYKPAGPDPNFQTENILLRIRVDVLRHQELQCISSRILRSNDA